MTNTENLSGQRVSATGGARRLVSSFARPANATTYTAGDAIADSTSARVIGFLEAGSGGMITGASIVMGETDTIALQLFVFDEEPTNFADNAPMVLVAADLDKLVGVFNFLDASKVNIGTGKELYRADVEPVGYAYTADSGALFGILVTRSAYTPVSGAFVAVNLHVEGDD